MRNLFLIKFYIDFFGFSPILKAFNWQKIKQAGYCREDASALGWDKLLPPATVRVSQVNGDHVSMMEHPVHRRELGQHFNLALRELGQA